VRLTKTSAAYLDTVVDKLMDAGCEIDRRARRHPLWRRKRG
jgi:hypothetical protein